MHHSIKFFFFKNPCKIDASGDFPGGPVVKTLPSYAGGMGSIPCQGAKILYGSWPKIQKVKQKQYCNKLNEDFENGPHKKKDFSKRLSNQGKKKERKRLVTRGNIIIIINGILYIPITLLKTFHKIVLFLT